MHDFILWVRAWPRYTSNFPFDRFDSIEDEEVLQGELLAMAHEWDRDHPDAVECNQESHRADHRPSQPVRASAVPLQSPKGSAASLPPPPPRLEHPRTRSFEEVAERAGWLRIRQGSRTQMQPLQLLLPTRRMLLAGISGEKRAKHLLASLRCHLPEHVVPKRHPGGHIVLKGIIVTKPIPENVDAVLRYGLIDCRQLPKPERVALELRLESDTRSDSSMPRWLASARRESARVLALLDATCSQKGVAGTASAEVGKRGPNSDPQRRLTAKQEWEAAAIFAVKDHPGWPDARIAREVGRDPAQLSRSPLFQAAARMARTPKVAPVRGYETVDHESQLRDVEAYVDDEGMPT